MTNNELIDEVTALIKSGNSDTTAANVRAILTEMVNSFQNIDEKNVAEGYAGVNGEGFIDKSLIDRVLLTMSDITLDPKYSAFVYRGATGNWVSMPVIGNKIYKIVNRGSGSITLSYPGGDAKIWDLSDGTAKSSVTILDQTAAEIIDDGAFLVISI